MDACLLVTHCSTLLPCRAIASTFVTRHKALSTTARLLTPLGVTAWHWTLLVAPMLLCVARIQACLHHQHHAHIF